MTSSKVAHLIDDGRWKRIHRGVYITHNGPIGWWARASAAVLYAGSGAALAHTAAAYAWDLESREPPVIRLVVPAGRAVRRPSGVRVWRRRRAATTTRRRLQVTTVTQTVLDLTAEPGCTPDDMATLVGRAVQRSAVGVEELRLALGATRAHPQRGLLSLVLGDIDEEPKAPSNAALSTTSWPPTGFQALPVRSPKRARTEGRRSCAVTSRARSSRWSSRSTGSTGTTVTGSSRTAGGTGPLPATGRSPSGPPGSTWPSGPATSLWILAGRCGNEGGPEHLRRVARAASWPSGGRLRADPPAVAAGDRPRG